MRTIKKIIHIKLTIITIILLPVVVFALLTSRVEVFGIRSFVVLTGSMQPTIPQGAIVFTRASQNYNQGEIVAFKSGNNTITHRIVDKTAKNNVLSYNTKGDANNAVDTSSVAHKDILGKTVFFVPFAGSFVLFLKTLPGFVAFIIVPGVLFILFELWTIKSHVEKEAEKKVLKKINEARQDVS